MSNHVTDILFIIFVQKLKEPEVNRLCKSLFTYCSSALQSDRRGKDLNSAAFTM